MTDTASFPSCTFLPWDSEFFGFQIGRVNGNRLDPALAAEVDIWCVAEKIRCLYFLAAAEDAGTVETAERQAFHQVDIRVTFELRLPLAGTAPAQPEGVLIRPARQADIAALKAIGSVSYTLSRFYFDPGFPRQRCDDLYSVWVEKSCQGYADEVLVAEIGGQAEGFITLKRSDPDSPVGEIGLVGISPSAQGRGLGPLLVEHSLGWFARQGMTQAEVVTQGRNIRAQRLYQRAGFITKKVQLWYHKWYHPNPC